MKDHPETNKSSNGKLFRAKMIIIYAFVGLLWVYFSNELMRNYFSASKYFIKIFILKDYLYVAILGVILFFFVNKNKNLMEISRLEKKVQEIEQLYKLLFEQIKRPIFIVESNNKVTINPAVEKLTGYQVNGLSEMSILSIIVSEDLEKSIQWFKTAKNGKSQYFETTIIHRNGRLITLSGTLNPVILNNEVISVVGIIEDYFESQQRESQAAYIDYRNYLTELPYRRFNEDIFKQALHRAKYNGQMMAVLFLNIDRFQNYNVALGHAFGDLLLQTLAKRLTEIMRQTDIVARIGGDEFVVILPNIMQTQFVTKVAQRILDGFGKPCRIEDHELFVTTSIGIALYPDDAEDVETLLKHADTAMHHAKKHGRNNYKFYTPAIEVKAYERLLLENELHKALDNNEFLVYYQPQIHIGTGQIASIEALVRWQHPTKGLVSPAQFISLAEESGLIVPVGEWVLRKACQQNKRWQEIGLTPIYVSVNLSTRQFLQYNLKHKVSEILNETGLDPKYLNLEITESIIMENHAIATLRELKELGICISIDDFGIGYSSLGYLKEFPVDILKVDKSFIDNLMTNSINQTIVSTIITLAHNLNLTVIAEGVENEEQLNFLKQQQCDGAQGYFISQPLSVEEFEKIFMKDC